MSTMPELPPLVVDYRDVLGQVHRELRPRTYVEIGVQTGATLCLVGPSTEALGIDPNPQLRFPIRKTTRVYTETSDDFFRDHDVVSIFAGKTVDLAFIDGMHLFEFALRDFRNLETNCSRESVILVHDCLPPTATSASRERVQRAWTGDVWKLLVCLFEQRPDIDIKMIAAAPTGLAMFRGLDPDNRILFEREAEIVERFGGLELSSLSEVLDHIPVVSSESTSIRKLLSRPRVRMPTRARSPRIWPAEMSLSKRARVLLKLSPLGPPLKRVRELIRSGNRK